MRCFLAVSRRRRIHWEPRGFGSALSKRVLTDTTAYRRLSTELFGRVWSITRAGNEIDGLTLAGNVEEQTPVQVVVKLVPDYGSSVRAFSDFQSGRVRPFAHDASRLRWMVARRRTQTFLKLTRLDFQHSPTQLVRPLVASRATQLGSGSTCRPRGSGSRQALRGDGSTASGLARNRDWARPGSKPRLASLRGYSRLGRPDRLASAWARTARDVPNRSAGSSGSRRPSAHAKSLDPAVLAVEAHSGDPVRL